MVPRGLILSLIAAIFFSGNFVNASLHVTIKNGTLEGMNMTTRFGRTIRGFLGIPYARPPIDELRFRPPQPFMTAWEKPYLATTDGSMCTQKDIITGNDFVTGQEDCLYLNVFTPIQAPDEAPKKYPVMVFFHGGGWVTGSSHSMLYGPKYLLDQDIILVTANYRLGALGFLATEDMASPGNQGMKDQVQVLRWVQENIAAFNGNKNLVTIFGSSAGSVSVHFHMLSPLSRGLFHHAISESGTVLSPWTTMEPNKAKPNAEILAKHLGCPTFPTTELVKCLRKKPAADIISNDYIFAKFDFDPPIPFRVVVEPDHAGAFLKVEPAESLKKGDIAPVPWLTGLTSEEGALRVAPLLGRKQKSYQQLNGNWMSLAAITLLYEGKIPKESEQSIALKIREFYLGHKKVFNNSTRMNMVDMYSDAWFNVATDESIRYHQRSNVSPVFFYYFNYRGSSSFSSIFATGDQTDYGVCHSDEIQYLFPIGEVAMPTRTRTMEDLGMIDVLTYMWSNFAKNGNPTTKGLPEWKPVKTDKLEYLWIRGSKNLAMSENLNPKRRAFWKNIFKKT